MDEPVIISPTIQEFRGVRYYKCGRYYQANGQRLHRVVWKAANGSIPRGAHIHHKDLNVEHNWSDNLVCIEPREHLSYHGCLRAGESAVYAEHARPSASQWHGSEEGIEWHRQQYERHCKDALHKKVERKCEYCGAVFQGIIRPNRFCSNACKSAARRAARADDETRTCIECGARFPANRYTKIRTCSRECGSAASARARTGVPQPKRGRKGGLSSRGIVD
jgi:hypothetical protein